MIFLQNIINLGAVGNYPWSTLTPLIIPKQSAPSAKPPIQATPTKNQPLSSFPRGVLDSVTARRKLENQ